MLCVEDGNNLPFNTLQIQLRKVFATGFARCRVFWRCWRRRIDSQIAVQGLHVLGRRNVHVRPINDYLGATLSFLAVIILSEMSLETRTSGCDLRKHSRFAWRQLQVSSLLG